MGGSLLPRANKMWEALAIAAPPSDDSSVEMWEVPPPPPTRLGDTSSTSLDYNDECPHVKEVISYELVLYFNCLV
jgi:hypothetical protein